MSQLVASDAVRTSSPDLEDPRIDSEGSRLSPLTQERPSSLETLQLLAYLGHPSAAALIGNRICPHPQFGDLEWFCGLFRWGYSLPIWIAIQSVNVASKLTGIRKMDRGLIVQRALGLAWSYAQFPCGDMADDILLAAEAIPERFDPTQKTCLRLAAREAAIAAVRAAESSLEELAEAAHRAFSFAMSATNLDSEEFSSSVRANVIQDILLGRAPVF